MKFKKIHLNIALLIIISVTFNSCIIVKRDGGSDVDQKINLSPKPKLEMSDKIVRSVRGDMISFIPKGWFFVDIENKLSPDIIAVATNPDYNLLAVFSEIRNSETIERTVKREGLFGLARASMSKRNMKSAGTVKQIGKFKKINMGQQNFVQYEFSSTEGALSAKSVVFISQLNEYYEFSLIPMTTGSRIMPPAAEVDNIFQSILASIKY